MTAVIKHSPGNFSAIFDQIEKFQNSHDTAWYRGTGDTGYSLVPTLLRLNPLPPPSELTKLERAIGNSFAQRSPPFVQTTFLNEWRALFFMQHYGIPTRLLDWTESPFVALYFALTSVKRDSAGLPLSDAAVWMCNPIAWNRTALAHITFQGGVLDEHCEEIKAYSPAADIDQRATTPIMIFGTHNSPRIVAQRGVFALFGKGIEGMEKTFNDGAFPANSLQLLVIKKRYINKTLKSLYRKGFAESTIYPDLFGLSIEIKRNFGFY